MVFPAPGVMRSPCWKRPTRRTPMRPGPPNMGPCGRKFSSTGAGPRPPRTWSRQLPALNPGRDGPAPGAVPEAGPGPVVPFLAAGPGGNRPLADQTPGGGRTAPWCCRTSKSRSASTQCWMKPPRALYPPESRADWGRRLLTMAYYLHLTGQGGGLPGSPGPRRPTWPTRTGAPWPGKTPY